MQRASTPVIKEAHSLRSTPSNHTPPPRNTTPPPDTKECTFSPLKSQRSMSPRRWQKANIQSHSRVMHEIMTSPVIYDRLKKDTFTRSQRLDKLKPILGIEKNNLEAQALSAQQRLAEMKQRLSDKYPMIQPKVLSPTSQAPRFEELPLDHQISTLGNYIKNEYESRLTERQFLLADEHEIELKSERVYNEDYVQQLKLLHEQELLSLKQEHQLDTEAQELKLQKMIDEYRVETAEKYEQIQQAQREELNKLEKTYKEAHEEELVKLALSSKMKEKKLKHAFEEELSKFKQELLAAQMNVFKLQQQNADMEVECTQKNSSIERMREIIKKKDDKNNSQSDLKSQLTQLAGQILTYKAKNKAHNATIKALQSENKTAQEQIQEIAGSVQDQVDAVRQEEQNKHGQLHEMIQNIMLKKTNVEGREVELISTVGLKDQEINTLRAKIASVKAKNKLIKLQSLK